LQHRFFIVEWFQRLLLRGIAWVVAHPWPTLVLAVLSAALCGGMAAAGLRVSSDQNELFSPRVPFFRDYLSFIKQFPENEAAYVLIRAAGLERPPVSRWTAAADALANRLRPMTQDVQAVDKRIPINHLGAQGLLFDSPQRVRDSRASAPDFAQLIKIWATAPGPIEALAGATPSERFLRLAAGAPDLGRAAPLVGLIADSWVRTFSQQMPGEKAAATNAAAMGSATGAGTSDVSANPRENDLTAGPQGIVVPDLAMLDATDPSRLGYYYVPDASDPTRHILLVRIYPRSDYNSLTAACAGIDAIRAAMAEVQKDFPEFEFGLSGRPVLEADEMRTTDTDSHHSEVLALMTVFLGLLVMLHSLGLALAAEGALLIAIGWTFGWATLSVGRLNLLSIVFLIALIGIGMDYLVQILSRYRSEAARRDRPGSIWHGVFRHVGPPINTACFGAAGAFLVSLLTQFRGAAELGIIAGVGLLLCLLAGYTVLPALLTIFPVKVPADVAMPIASDAVQPAVGWTWIIGPILWIAALGAMAPQMHKARFDSNLLNLQAKNLPSVQLVRSLPTWSAVELSTDLDLLGRVRDAVATSPVVASTESLLNARDNQRWLHQQAARLPKIDWVMPDPVKAAQLGGIADAARAMAKKLAAAKIGAGDISKSLDEVADMIDHATASRREQMAAQLTAWQKAFVQRLQQTWSQYDPPPLDTAALPAELRKHYISDDGMMALYIYPKGDLWQQGQITQFVTDIEKRIAQVNGAPPPTGIAINIYHSTDSIRMAFYHATTYALILIVLLVWFDLRDVRLTLLAVSVLALGLPMLVGMMGLLDVRWNFANFFALPILIGAGHEYGVFLVHRYVEARLDRRRVWKAWDVSDRALLLCAFVTTSSFAYFWLMGHHEGLRSLGLVMAMGTVSIYLSAVVVLRPVLVWNLAHTRKLTEEPELESVAA
jgi:hypothetical protein